MLIDWFTVIAQVINFLILVILLRRFLYKPVLKAIADREKNVADRLNAAALKETQAQQAKDKYQQLNDTFARERNELFRSAGTEAAAERSRLLEEGRREADQLRARLTDSITKEQSRQEEELNRRTETEVLNITRKVLADLAGTTLESQMVRVFIRRLQDLPDEEVRTWTSAAAPSVLVRTAFDLQPADREALEKAWHEKFATAFTPSFERRPDLVTGIELAVDGYKLSWTVADYLESLEKNIPHGDEITDHP